MSSRIRMSWDWVGDYPIFVYTRFITHGVFSVRVAKGVKHDQNAKITNEADKNWITFTSRGLTAKDDVVLVAFKHAREQLDKELDGHERIR